MGLKVPLGLMHNDGSFFSLKEYRDWIKKHYSAGYYKSDCNDRIVYADEIDRLLFDLEFNSKVNKVVNDE